MQQTLVGWTHQNGVENREYFEATPQNVYEFIDRNRDLSGFILNLRFEIVARFYYGLLVEYGDKKLGEQVLQIERKKKMERYKNEIYG